MKGLAMQSKTEDIIIELERSELKEKQPRVFELYEAYSQREISEIITDRRAKFEKADVNDIAQMIRIAEKEVEDFRMWLEETKNLDHTDAHYYSTSLKTLLLGLPMGIQVAWLFDAAFDRLDKSRTCH
jgi:hypothetical protein